MMIGYVATAGPLHRAHPLTALTFGATVAVLAFVLRGPWGPVAVLAVALGAAFAERVPGVLKPAALLALPFWIFLLIIHGVLRSDMATAVTLGARISAILVGFLVVLSAVPPSRLVEALVAKRVPFSAAFLLAATLQAVPRLRERAVAVLEAQRCRGLALRGSLVHRARAIVPLTVPLVLGALGEVDERALALEARGAGAGRRTPLDPPRDGATDHLVRWCCAALIVVAIVVRVA